MLEPPPSCRPKPDLPAPPLGKPVLAAITVVTLAGALLRIAAARCDLWLDEIWSFRLIGQVRTASDIVFALPYDNNHILNSLWLKLVGADASPLVARLPAIVFGVLSIPVAARLGARIGPLAAVVFAAIFAFDFAFVEYGSEARGYSGLILAILVALDALENMLDGRSPRRNQAVFALAIAFGTLSHLTMLESTGVLCLTAILRLWRSGGWRLATLDRARPILVAAAAGTAPALVSLAISLAPGVVHTGLATPFSADAFLEGLGRMIGATIGLPDGPFDPKATALMLLIVGIGALGLLCLIPPRRRYFYVLAICGLPVFHAALHLPNQQGARFHLTAAIALALLAAEGWARAWAGGGGARVVALTAGVGFAICQYESLSAFLTHHRGHFAEATALMSEHGPATFMVLPPVAFGETAAVIRWYVGKQDGGAKPEPATAAGACPASANWLLIVHHPNEPVEASGSSTVVGSGPCGARFDHAKTFKAYGLSGFTWVLFRRAG
ncbi:MAG: hypothetical protein P4L76_14100 [Beijerinckiaceae bacterium]|nr:hypothetical protein [Beijerinckiaceae bacterium]